MSTDTAKLKRLRRLERLRGIVRQTALTEAARAEQTLAQITNLEARTASLIEAYRLRRDAHTGQDLRQSQQFVAGLTRIADQTATDLIRARQAADARAAEAAEAERRRAAVDDRITATRQRLARKSADTPHPAKPASQLGTGLE